MRFEGLVVLLHFGDSRASQVRYLICYLWICLLSDSLLGDFTGRLF